MTRESAAASGWLSDVRAEREHDETMQALLEVVEAAHNFVGGTSVFWQRKVDRDAFTRLAVGLIELRKVAGRAL